MSLLSSEKHHRLGEWMLAKGMITQDQLDIALIEQQKQGLLLGQQLVRLHFVTDAMLRDVLAHCDHQETVDLLQVIPDPEAIAKVPESFARQYHLLPLAWSADGQVMRVALTDHKNKQALGALQRALGANAQVQAVLVTEPQLEQALDKFYGHSLSLETLLREIEQEDTTSSLIAAQQDARPVIRLVNAILTDAVKQGASDIHFEPEQAYLRIRYRIDGVLWQVRCLHDRYWPAMCVRLKIMAGLDIAEQRMPQDGRVNLHMCGRQIDFRVSSHPTLHGENIVLRVLDRDKTTLALDAMGLRPAQLQRIKQLLARPEGLLILTGPTGSGKTSTLYAMLAALNHEPVNIMTLEDPVEYPHVRMRQTSVNAATKIDFANGIRAILRQDPDVILIGEVRDEATATMAVRAAMTGHLVFTTLHTNSAFAAFSRLQDLGVSAHMVSHSVVGVIAQRLLRRLCIHCKQPAAVNEELARLIDRLSLPAPTSEFVVYASVGCVHCRMTGYQGRMAILEVLTLPPAMMMVSTTLPLPEMQRQARVHGYTTLAEEGLHALLAGHTSWQELRRVVDLSGWSDDACG